MLIMGGRFTIMHVVIYLLRHGDSFYPSLFFYIPLALTEDVDSPVKASAYYVTQTLACTQGRGPLFKANKKILNNYHKP